MNVPARFSKIWWAWVLSTGLACGAVVTIALYFLGELSDTKYIWAFVISAVVGDLVVALGFEAIAPTRITVGPGDRHHVNSPVKDRAKVVADFSADGSGKVRVRGEVWNARCSSVDRTTLAAGQEVRVAGRDGLTLLVDGGTNDT